MTRLHVANGLMVFALSLVVSCSNRPPYSFLPPIAEEYFRCEKCGSLDGGIYGKGPLMHPRTSTGDECVHDWKLISRVQFKEVATASFGVDWSTKGPWWARE